MKGNKVTAEDMDRDLVSRALAVISDGRNYPILVHCRSGKHRTGALIGCFRRLQGHKLSRIHEEYVQFAGHKQRKLDRMYIENTKPEGIIPLLAHPVHRPPWLLVRIATPSPTGNSRRVSAGDACSAAVCQGEGEACHAAPACDGDKAGHTLVRRLDSHTPAVPIEDSAAVTC